MNSDKQQAALGVKEFPVDKGYYFPAEFAPHEATWLSWPHKEASWPGKIHTIYSPYCQFIRQVAEGELVHVMVKDQSMEDFAKSQMILEQVDLTRVLFHHFPTNDAWCRDHGPAFLINPTAANNKVVVNWGYNAWGDKYPPYDLDNLIPERVAEYLNLPCYHPGIVMEGGSVDFNGKGTLLTTTSCLLNTNRNPHLTQTQIEGYLRKYYGVEQILWLGDGIEGDDTDGHVDDITRFVSDQTVITVVEDNKRDANFHPLRENLKLLESFRLLNGSPLNIVELPMPSPVIYEGTRLPASYANFYIANSCVVVPTFRDKNDDRAIEIIQQCFRDRKVVGVDSLDIIWGLGSFHCLSQQEPRV